MAPPSVTCAECKHAFTLGLERCPHCGRPGLFANVTVAEQPDERAAVDTRYRDARHAADKRGCLPVVEDFERAVADGARAVIARPLGEVQRLATSDKQGYATYYELIASEVRFPDGDEWDELRHLADEALFPGYKDKIRFAALSLDGVGVANYGECWLTLRTPFIAHRASVFETNSTMFMTLPGRGGVKLGAQARGYRAPWDDRSRLCVAKLAARLDASTKPPDYGTILLRQGATSSDDELVEAHVWGPMTIRTVERVIISTPRPRGGKKAKPHSKTILKALGEDLTKYGVDFEVRP